jgi:hypothetical protein
MLGRSINLIQLNTFVTHHYYLYRMYEKIQQH